MWNLEFLVLNDDDKRDPKELFKELAEKCKEEENKQTPAPKQNFV